jgi:iron complex outermembrane receptor protein
LRGIDQTRVNTTLNGVPMAEPEDQGAYFSNYTDLLNSINSIQVQRGVGTSSNGSASYAGSINLESSNLLDTSYVNIQSGVGSYNSNRFSVGFNSGLLKNNFAFYGRYSNTYSDGFRDHSGTNANTMFFSGAYYGKNNIVKVVAFTGHSENQMAYLASSADTLKKDFKNNPLTSSEKDHFVQTFIQIQDVKSLGLYSTLTSSIYYTGLQGNYGVLGVISPTQVSDYILFSDLYGAMTNYSYNRNNLRINLGINAYYYYREHAMDSTSLFSSSQSYKNKGEKEEVSAYAKVGYDIGKFTIYADLQGRSIKFSYYQLAGGGDSLYKNYVTWSFLNPKAGVKFNITSKSDLYLSVGQSHREPTRTGMFAGSDNIIPTLKELPSTSESVIDYELGTNYKSKSLSVQGDFFYMKSTNEFTPIGPLSNYTGLPLMIQVPNSTRYGVELDLTYKISKHFRYFFNSTYMKGIINESNGTNVSPVLTPNLIINHGVECFYNKVSVGLSGRYISQSYLDLVTQNSTLLLPETPMQNLIANSVFLKLRVSRSINLTFNVNNIMNNQYYSSGYSVNLQPYYYVNATRNYFVSLNATF